VDRPVSALGGSRLTTLAALEAPSFRWLMGGLFCSMVSYAMQNLARGYLAYDLTGSSAAASLVLAAWGVPMILVGPVAGVVADRIPKRRVLFGTQGTLGVCALLTAVLVQLGIVELWQLIVLGLFQGAAFGFNIPTRQAIVAELVSHERIGNAIALMNAGSALSAIAGPAAAGLLVVIPAIGVAGVMYLSAALYLLVLVSFTQLPSRPAAPGARASFVYELVDGLRYVRDRPLLRTLLLLSFLMAAVGQPYQYLLPAFVAGALEAGADELGLLMSAIGLGSLFGSLLVATLAASRQRARLQVVGGLIFSAALVVFAASSSIPLSALTLFVAGAMTTGYLSFNQAALVEATGEAFRGRVLSVASLVTAVGSLAMLPYGMLMDTIGMRETVAGGGLLMAAALTGATLLVPAVWREPEARTPPPAERV
jgi:MFS family permease